MRSEGPAILVASPSSDVPSDIQPCANRTAGGRAGLRAGDIVATGAVDTDG